MRSQLLHLFDLGRDQNDAAIIGAMLISPLMGPIIALGYALGVADFALLRQAVRCLGLFALLSLASATLYYLISPLSQAQSELLARTSPTLWDALIAFFGGAAGMVALTRRAFSNVVPGVAIATALMPPLCTAGYGIASGNPRFFVGAFYLFAINGVFIACATLVFVKLMRLPPRGEMAASTRRRARLLIGGAVVLALLPSVWLGYELVRRELFLTAAHRVLEEVDRDGRLVVLTRVITPERGEIVLTVGGALPPAGLAADIERRMAQAGVRRARVTVRRVGAGELNLVALKGEPNADLYRLALRQLEEANAKWRRLEDEAHQRQSGLQAQAALVREIAAQYPAQVTVAQGLRVRDGTQEEVVVVTLRASRPLTLADRTRLQAWLDVRFAGRRVELWSGAHPSRR
jgi:uncharacterized hydrophobic protein (TIGR00271 family)